MLTKRDIAVLECLGRYFVMNRRQVQRLCYRNDHDGRITRRRLQALSRSNYINKQRMLVVNPDDDTAAPVYVLGNVGRQFLAEHFKDDRYLLKPVQIAHAQHIFHHLAVTETHITLDHAVDRQDAVTLIAWHNEYDITNADEADPRKHFRLFTELRTEPKKIVCAPDAGFMIDYKGHRGVYYLEQDRGHGRFDHKRVCNRKYPGYVELLRQQQHRKHFPNTTLDRFIVLFVTNDADRRDALRRAFREKKEQGQWRFVARTDITPESLLHERILYRCDDDEPQAMVKL